MTTTTDTPPLLEALRLAWPDIEQPNGEHVWRQICADVPADQAEAALRFLDQRHPTRTPAAPDVRQAIRDAHNVGRISQARQHLAQLLADREARQ